jgi:hypothetical protein
MNAQKFKRLLADSHRRQFAGEDFQTVAIDIAEENKIAFESEEYTSLQTGPDPSCECGFCATASWED